jgi:LuxR family transcriptional regulator, maltose regulon positive regulatory protein
MDLIHTKITIPDVPQHVSRQRILATLEESLNTHSSTLIIGRAGTGKTTSAVDFVQKCGRCVAWYKVDAPDAKFHIFLRYLVESVARELPGFGLRLLTQVTPPSDEANSSKLAEIFVYDLQKHVEPLIIVIDDLHLIYDADWVVPFFHRLLPLLPAEVHLLILGRSLPPAPLWRLRSKQRLCVIDEVSLALTLEEAEALYAVYGLTPQEAVAAWIKTRGRAAAIYAEATRAKTNVAAA